MKILTDQGRIIAGNALVGALAIVIVYSGFAYPLTYGSGFWPFNRDWFMFSTDTGYDFELQAEAEMKDGTFGPLDVTPLFSFQVGSDGNRFQETPRTSWAMFNMATYLCTHFPVRWVNLKDYSWQRPMGRRLRASEVPPDKITVNAWVNHYRCR